MANYYNFLSFTVPLTPAQQDWAIEELTRASTDEDEDESDAGVVCERSAGPTHLLNGRETSGFLWITSDECACIDQICARLQNIMRHFDIDGKWGFAWAQHCSKPRLDAYGGGACTVSQTESEWINTFQWLDKQGIANQWRGCMVGGIVDDPVSRSLRSGRKTD